MSTPYTPLEIEEQKKKKSYRDKYYPAIICFVSALVLLLLAMGGTIGLHYDINNYEANTIAERKANIDLCTIVGCCNTHCAIVNITHNNGTDYLIASYSFGKDCMAFIKDYPHHKTYCYWEQKHVELHYHLSHHVSTPSWVYVVGSFLAVLYILSLFLIVWGIAMYTTEFLKHRNQTSPPQPSTPV